MGQTDRPDDRRVAGSRLPPTANLLSKGITKRLNPESQNARKSRPAPGFLAKSNTCSRQITAINQRLPNTSRTTLSGGVREGNDGRPDLRRAGSNPSHGGGSQKEIFGAPSQIGNFRLSGKFTGLRTTCPKFS